MARDSVRSAVLEAYGELYTVGGREVPIRLIRLTPDGRRVILRGGPEADCLGPGERHGHRHFLWRRYPVGVCRDTGWRDHSRGR